MDSTGSAPATTSDMSLADHSTPGLFTVSSLQGYSTCCQWMDAINNRVSVRSVISSNTFDIHFYSFCFMFLFFNLTYSRWTSSLPSCLWPLRIFPPLPGSRLTIFYRDASSAILQLVNQWLDFTYSRFHAFRYVRKSTNPPLIRIELTTSALARVQVTYY